MSLLDRILNRTPEMQELKKENNYPIMAENQPKPRVTFEAITGIKNKVGNALNKGGNFLEEALFGEVVKPAPTQVKTNADGNTIVETAINNDARQGGIIPDLMTGFKENLGEKFSTSNLTDTKDKGFIYRLGEGLGTATRFLDSPLGRGLAVAGAVGALGGSGGDALAYGLGTTAQNQGLRMQDRIYRDDLEKIGFDTTGINGYITEDMYKNVISSQRAKNNRQNVGELAMLSPVIKKFVDANPALANVDIPASVANSLLRGDYTEAQIKAIMSNIALNNVKAGYYGSLTDVNKAALGEIGKGGGGVVVHTQPPQVGHKTNVF